jgi:L-ascorbate metabolism protein UlaG (beta-lactamase superfamily)
MEITSLGHSCFRIRAREVSVLTDPFKGDGLGGTAVSASADVVTVSHDHPNHAHTEGVAGSARVLNAPGEYEIGGAIIWGVRTNRRDTADEHEPHRRNVSYVVQVEDLTVCHLGDLGAELTAEQLDHIKDCDILFVPVGGTCTLGPSEAAKVVAQIEPKVIIPMHYASEGGSLQLESVERFCREMGAAEVVPQTRLNVTVGTLPTEPTVFLLEPRA